MNAAGVPLISFIVPAHNEEFELPDTLASIDVAARGVGERYEIVVADDASTDSTATVATQFGAHVVGLNRRQIAAARNAGARAARGDIFVFVDADTRITSALLRAVRGAIDAGYVGGGARMKFDERAPGWTAIVLPVFSAIYFGLMRFAAGGFVFATREAFAAVGGFDEAYFAGEEIFFSRAMRRIGRFTILREPAVTSARKLRLFSGRRLFRDTIFLLVAGMFAVRSRRYLGLWYGGARESRS